MARTLSRMLPLGTPAPDFKLPDAVSGAPVGLKDVATERGTVVMFICNHCPFVKHVRAELAALARDYQPRGIGFVAISSNDVDAYPADGPELMKREAAAAGYSFPYLYDATQATARAYDAACTPDFYLFDGTQKLIYRGQLDDSRPDNGLPVTGRDLRAALDAVLEGRPVAAEQQPSLGCNIKWKG